MKKWIVVCLVGSVWLAGCERQQVLPTVGEVGENALVEVVIDWGDREESYETSVDNEASALSVLEAVAVENGIEIVVQEFEFGKLVESVGGVESTQSLAWIYYVDGQAGNVGAESKSVGGGQVVEWRYEDVE